MHELSISHELSTGNTLAIRLSKIGHFTEVWNSSPPSEPRSLAESGARRGRLRTRLRSVRSDGFSRFRRPQAGGKR